MAQLAENRYGKSRIRLVRLHRQSPIHEFDEWNIEILLSGDFRSCFAEGDNSKILPTDTMKNTVYFLARRSAATCIEEFAEELVEHLLIHNPQLTLAEVSIQEKSWQHLNLAGKPHPTTFDQTGTAVQTTRVTQKRSEKLEIESGLSGLVLMKTAASAFEGYVHDPLTTLPETRDRLLGTSLFATWTYVSDSLPFKSLRTLIREALLAAFASHQSKSVQHTLFAMAEAALAAAPQISDITLTMPNKHCLLVDLSPFGQDNPNHIFMPIDEPHGTIEARVCRGS